ncbi:helix-turn-helix domain-containing protein [Roseivirga sp. E12]|uniref:winged helix-turn-helix transcriptional regulator n=1 Tax=Roseivirga sp. E12 TaxID=2819237 RepID=UPI001ABD3177|nr:helix-turn-helix domain-containing protein [Roseivirga sp. E12]MBO3696847.1 helix-turn-helix transcriptional regulator [Roseivirga sp. E12]
MKKLKTRTHCPISFGLDFFGDKWSFLIIRDLAFKGKNFYNDFLDGGEGISTNILSDRLKQLELIGIITSEKIKQKQLRKKYTLTEKGKDLIPILIEYIVWSFKYDPETEAGEDFVNQAINDRASLLKGILDSLE